MSKRIKCEGRFSSLREYLFDEIFPFIDVSIGENVTSEKLLEAYSLIEEGDKYNFLEDSFLLPQGLNRGFDSQIPRTNSHLDLVPLIPSTYTLNSKILEDYFIKIGLGEDISTKLSKFASQSGGILDPKSELTGKDIKIGKKSLEGFLLKGLRGIGTIVPGGIHGGGTRSDSPLLIGVYKVSNNGEEDLVSTLGFWAKPDSTMLISQMQECKNAQFPSGIDFGDANLAIAEETSRRLGFDTVQVYSPELNPLLLEHKGQEERFIDILKPVWENSPKNRDYELNSDGLFEKKL